MSTLRTNRRVVLAARPNGAPRPEDFRLDERPVPSLGQGQVLIETLWLSLDPYMRGQMDEGSSGPDLGDAMKADVVGRVAESRCDGLEPGAVVLAYAGWETAPVCDGAALRVLDPDAAPLTTALGALGMPGHTAYAGLLRFGRPKPGETLVVAAAAGPVGSIVGQIGKLKGCRVVGVAGGPAKARHLTEDLGFDAGLDHRAPDFGARLATACANGIDVYFESVGGHVSGAVLPLLNRFARIPVCGLVAHYNDVGPPPGPDRLPDFMEAVLTKRLAVQGFMWDDFAADDHDFRRDMSGWFKSGAVTCREQVVEGLDRAPDAFMGMLRGENFGKLLVRVAS